MQINLANNLRNLRKKNNMTQEELAERLNVSLGVVSKWERGASEPELASLVAIAEAFRVSVDALIGYEMSEDSPETIVERISVLKNQMKIQEAVEVINDALIKFPNNLKIVHCAASLFMLTELSGCGDSYDRAIVLYNKAITLLAQDTKGEFSEVEIRNEIAFCLLQQEKVDEAIEVLEANNVSGINDDMLGTVYVQTKHDYAKGITHLAQACAVMTNKFVRIVSGFVNAYAYTDRFDEAARLCDLFAGITDMIAINPKKATFMDKLNAAFMGGAATWYKRRGDTDSAEQYFQRAYASAKKYDDCPTHSVDNVLMMNELPATATVFDDISSSAMEAVEKVVSDDDNCGAFEMWKEIRRVNENKRTD